MGIFCEINLNKPSDGVFVGAAGNVVSGVIKYSLDEETVFNRITVSLKGLGVIQIEGYSLHQRRISNDETFIDIDNVIQDNEKGLTKAVGSYEIPFHFVIPKNLPPSVSYQKFGAEAIVKCRIKYYVRIKFNKKGTMNSTKRFKKPITVVSGIDPRLPTTPTIYGEQKKITQLLSFNSKYIDIKANINNSVLNHGDKIEFRYEITNNTSLEIKGVETKLVEVHKFFFHPTKPLITEYDDVIGTDAKTSTVKSGETQSMSVEINIPLDRESTDYCKIYSRGYCVCITAHLPLPHRNHVLKIPIQIGNIFGENFGKACKENDKPPTYWEAMNEYEQDKIKLDEIDYTEDEQKTKST